MALISHWSPSFNKLDANADASVTTDEAKAAWKDLPVGNSPKWQKAAVTAFNAADQDGNGAVSQDEALSFNQTVTADVKAQMLRYQEFIGTAGAVHDGSVVFANADADKDGEMTADELASALEAVRPNHGCQHDLASTIVAQFDTDANGSLNADETAALTAKVSERLARLAANGYAVNLIKNYLAASNSTEETGSETSDVAA